MLQRIQSLYLLGAGILAGLFVFLPVAILISGDETIRIYIGKSVPPVTTFGVLMTTLTLLFTLLSVAALGIIFLFKSRKRQIRWIRIQIAFTAFAILLTLLYFWKWHSTYTDAIFSWSMVLTFPVISIVLLFLAGKSVRKDQDLVDSLNRIR